MRADLRLSLLQDFEARQWEILDKAEGLPALTAEQALDATSQSSAVRSEPEDEKKSGAGSSSSVGSSAPGGHTLGVVRELLGKVNILALGSPAGIVTGSHGTESDLLHFTIDAPDGSEIVMLPIFTDDSVLREALIRNPEWQDMSVLEIAAASLLGVVDPDVTVVLNPWSPLEFQIPPSAALS
jgi:hypothetical protein